MATTNTPIWAIEILTPAIWTSASGSSDGKGCASAE